MLRSSGEVKVKALEQAHLNADSALHVGARDKTPDTSAFFYCVQRLPACIMRVRRVPDVGLRARGQAATLQSECLQTRASLFTDEEATWQLSSQFPGTEVAAASRPFFARYWQRWHWQPARPSLRLYSTSPRATRRG